MLYLFKVHDINNQQDQILNRLCGMKSGVVLKSKGDKMQIRFKSDGSTSAKGFLATYKTKKKSCEYISLIDKVTKNVVGPA